MEKYTIVHNMYTDVLKIIDNIDREIEIFGGLLFAFITIILGLIIYFRNNLEKFSIFKNSMWILYLIGLFFMFITAMNLMLIAYKGKKVLVTNNAEKFIANVKDLEIDSATDSLCNDMSICISKNVTMHTQKQKYMEMAKNTFWVLINFTLIMPIIIEIIIKLNL